MPGFGSLSARNVNHSVERSRRASRADALGWSMKSWLTQHRREATIAAVTLVSTILYSIWVLVVAPAVAAQADLATISILGAQVRRDLVVALLGAYAIALVASILLNSLLTRLYGEIDRAREQAIRQETVVYMAATMAHEVFQPLTVIQAGVQFICRHQLPPDRQQELCNRVVRSTRRLAEIVRRFEHTTEAAMRERGGHRWFEIDDRARG